MYKYTMLAVVGSATLVTGLRLESRAAQTSAICGTNFSWMQNSKGASPCQAVASIDALCNNGNWVINALPPNTSYTNPNTNDGTASFCTCSWASYNLLSACVTCQGVSQETPPWSVYSVGCPGLLSNSFFPSNITLPEGVAIPAWAETDPTTWDGQTFNVAQAKPIADEGKPDFQAGSTSAPQHKSTNIGAIVGGVIGGLIVLVGAALAAFWIIRRKRAGTSAPSSSFHPGHGSTYSDGSLAKLPNGYAPMRSHAPTSPTINSSMQSFPMFSSTMNGRAPNVVSPLTPGPSQQAPSTLNFNSPENIIEPFTSPPNAENPDRKQAHGPQPIYDHPSAPPPMRVDSTRAHMPRGRVNPPAYTPSSPGSVTSALPGHSSKPSVDTQHSRDRSTDIYVPNASGSGNLVGQMPPVTESMHGRTLSGESRDQKRPVLEYSASEVA